MEAEYRYSTACNARRDAHPTRRTSSRPANTPLLRASQYRTVRNYQCMDYLGPRLFDKVIFALVIMSLYFGIGDDFIGACSTGASKALQPTNQRASTKQNAPALPRTSHLFPHRVRGVS